MKSILCVLMIAILSSCSRIKLDEELLLSLSYYTGNSLLAYKITIDKKRYYSIHVMPSFTIYKTNGMDDGSCKNVFQISEEDYNYYYKLIESIDKIKFEKKSYKWGFGDWVYDLQFNGKQVIITDLAIDLPLSEVKNKFKTDDDMAILIYMRDIISKSIEISSCDINP